MKIAYKFFIKKVQFKNILIQTFNEENTGFHKDHGCGNYPESNIILCGRKSVYKTLRYFTYNLIILKVKYNWQS